MMVKVKIDENQEFKDMIIKRIQQELHEILKTNFNDIVRDRVNTELERKFNFSDWNYPVNEKIDEYIKEFIENRVKKIVGDNSYYSNSKIDEYINNFIDKKLTEKFDKLFKKRFNKGELSNK